MGLKFSAHATLVSMVTLSCSEQDAQSPTSEASDATSSAAKASDSAASTATPLDEVSAPAGTSSDPDLETATPEATDTGAGVIEPAEPVVLASEVVFGARLCLGANQQLYFPNRIGYPLTPGQEQLWVVSRSGGDARAVATPGSATGCFEIDGQVWMASNETSSIARLDIAGGTLLEGYPTPGTPLQITGNSNRVFASLSMGSTSATIVSIDPTMLAEPQTIWSKAGRVAALWLRASDERLLFSATDGENAVAWVVQVQLASGQVAELATTASELGAVDGAGNFVYYANYSLHEVHRLDLSSGADTVLASIEHPWSLVVDGEYLYVGARPDYCANKEGKLYRVPLAGGATTLLADELNCPSQIVSDAKGLYWINTGSWLGPGSDSAAPADGSVMYLPRR